MGDMTDEQADKVVELLQVYTGRLRAELAKDEFDKITAAGLPGVHFAWAGSAEPGEPHYYRIHGPTFLIEYDNTQNDANHVHSVWRDLSGDSAGTFSRSTTRVRIRDSPTSGPLPAPRLICRYRR